MNNGTINEISVTPIHPGVMLENLLASKEMSQKDLSIAIGKPSPMVNDIIKQKRNMNAEIAILLETVLPEISAEDWMNMQCLYDISILRNDEKMLEKQTIIRGWQTIKEKYNIKALKKKIPFINDLNVDVKAILDYIGFNSLNEFQKDIASAERYHRKSLVLDTDQRNLRTWEGFASHESSQISLETQFDIGLVSNLTEELNNAFYEDTDILVTAKRILSKYGIKLVIENKLEKTPIDGMAFWSGDNPTIALTLRYKRIDNFAFNIFHELGHIVNDLYANREGKFTCNTMDKTNGVDKIEEAANQYAHKAIWGDFDYAKYFRSIKIPFAAQPFLERLSRERHINIGVIAGQYQHYCDANKVCSSPYSVCRNLISTI